MNRRQTDIQALLTQARQQLREVDDKYQSSLTAKSVSLDLKVKIKNLCENLRSVLDYLAHDIRETKCSKLKESDRFYFSILPDRKQFESKMREWFPRLDSTAPDLWSYLELIQPYHGTQAEWLGELNRVNNENKHSALVEQSRTEIERVAASSSSGSVEWSPQNVRFGNGVSILGVLVDPSTQLPVPLENIEYAFFDPDSFMVLMDAETRWKLLNFV